MKIIVAAFCIAISLSTQAGAAQDRVYLAGTVPPWVTKAQKIGTADDSQRVLFSGRKGTENRSKPMLVRGNLGTILAHSWHKEIVHFVND